MNSRGAWYGSGGLQHELNLDGVKWKFNTAIMSGIENASIQQGLDVTMHCLDIAMRTPGHFPNRERSRAAHDFE